MPGGASISVRLDDFHHQSNKLGYFYFGASQLELKSDEQLDSPVTIDQDNYFRFEVDPEESLMGAIEKALNKTKEENTMSTIPMLPNFRVAGVYYPEKVKAYAFALYDEDIEIGDKVVVRNSSGQLHIVELASIDELPRDSVLNGCEVVCRLDMTAYEERQYKARKIYELKQEMDAKVAQLQAVALYELMAEKDPALKVMLETLKELTK